MSRIVRTLGLCGAVLACGVGLAGPDAVMKAMQDELARSKQSLRMEGLEKPYFVAYRIDDVETLRAAAEFGSLLSREEDRSRTLDVELRVGDYALDNTNFRSSPFGGSGGMSFGLGRGRLPLEDNYLEIRRQIWLATDAAYKKALEDFAKKRASLQNKTRTDEVPDFSKEKPVESTETIKTQPPDLEKAARLVTELSALFREMPEISFSRVTLTARVVRTRYVNSEGTTYERTIPEVRFNALARTQAEDGMVLNDFVDAYGRSLNDLPNKDALAKRITAMGQRLTAARNAPLLDTYNGPVLFEGRAAAELLAQVMAPKLIATPKPLFDNPMFEQMANQQENPWLDKLGARVLPRSMSVVDDPTLDKYADRPLLGGYAVDSEGVLGRKTTLVERGMLRSFLTGRGPVRGGLRSTGNRRGENVAPSNLVFTSSQSLSAEELKAELLLLAQDRGLDHGIIVRGMVNPALIVEEDPSPMMFIVGGPQGGAAKAKPLIAVYRVAADGSEHLLRNVELGEMGLGALKEIIATSERQTVHTLPFQARSESPFARLAMFAGMGLGAPLVSMAVPDLLFEDLTLKKPTGEIPNPPVAGHPFFEE